MKQITSSAAAGIASHRIASQCNRRILERFLIVLAFLGVLLIGLAAPRAQVAYNFQQPDQIALVSTTTDAGYDILTMDCLAANGYGQWTSSINPQNANEEPSCFLLGNKLFNLPSTPTTGFDDAQAGVLASKEFSPSNSYPTTDAIKCAANLKGNVRWVWPTNGGTEFYVEGFDPGPAGGTTGIDISFTSLYASTPDLSIVKSSAASGGIAVHLHPGHSVTTVESALDQFDIAIDASFLYIVWEEYASGTYSVWAVVVKLSDGSVPSGWPAKIATNALRPTVSVDIRNSGSSPGNFDVAYLDQNVGTPTGHVYWTEWNGSAFNTPQLIGSTFTGGSAPNWVAPLHARILTASEAGVTPSTSNQRAVYVIAGTEDCPSYSFPCKMHLFLDYIYNGGPPSTTCEYCDGFYNTARPTGCPVENGLNFQLVDNPIWAFADPYEGVNSNNPGPGMANDFTEFHCLYQLQRSNTQTAYGHPIILSYTFTSTPTPNNPLMIIPGSNVGNGFCVNGKTSTTFSEDPVASGLDFDGYCGAVNQMGIHIHWTGSDGTHFYRRDKREFEQNIEENTLLTDTCVVGNSETLVGGTPVGINDPTLLSNLYLTLYTDPNVTIGAGLDVMGFPVANAWLDFDNEASLNIGSSTNSGSDFVLLQPFASSFLGQLPGLVTPLGTCSTNSWTINFAAGNNLDYYGVITEGISLGEPQFFTFGDGQFTLTGSGETLWPNGTPSGGQYVSSISDPVTWTIHNSGMVLIPCNTSNNINITATDAIFDFQSFGAGVSEPSSIATCCNGSFTNCKFVQDAASTFFGVSMFISGNGTWDPSTCSGTLDGNYSASDYLAAGFHTVSLTDCYSEVGFDMEGSPGTNGPSSSVGPASASVNGGLFLNYGFSASALDLGLIWWPVSITNATFNDMYGEGILINLSSLMEGIPFCERAGAISQAYSVTIDNNAFEYLSGPSDISGFSDFSSAIFIYGAPDLSGSDALRGAITVSDNVIAPGWTPGGFTFDAGIHFGDVSGVIEGNTFVPSSSGFCVVTGIWNESSEYESGGIISPTNNPTSTFICSNVIEGCDTGVSTDNWIGYEKLDEIYNDFPSGGGIGHVSSFKDNGHIDFTWIDDELGPGYLGTDGSITDMSGVHHPHGTGDDPAGDTIMPSCTDCAIGAAIYLDQSNAVSDGNSLIMLGQEEPSWTIFGENNIQGSPDILSVPTTPLTDIFDISNNYWGGGAPTTSGVTFTDAGDLSLPPAVTGFSCGSTGLFTKKAMLKPMSFPTNDTETQCDSLFFAGYNDVQEMPQNFQNGYDTIQLFMEQCPFYTNRWNGITAAHMFDEESEAAGALVGGNKLTWDQQLAWLKSVLYLNPDTVWYCQDVGDIIQAVQNDSNEVSSVLQYIYNSGKCPGLNGEWLSRDVSVHEHWLDSIEKLYGYPPYGNNPTAADSINKDTLAHPFVDTTTFPSVTQIGLSILLGPPNGAVAPSAPVSSQALLSAQLIENPVNDNEIDISYEMGREALVTMELRDVLGRSVPIANAKYQLEQPGSHNATIPTPNLRSGTYYLRITTDAGDAITLKVVKE